MPTLTPDLTAAADYRAFLSHIIREPEDNDHRLIFADWLEEHGDEAWAEYIRVGCELARHEADRLASGKSGWRTLKLRARVVHLRARELALRTEHEARWRRGSRCERCGGKQFYRRAADGSEMVPMCCHGIGWSGSLAERMRIAGTFKEGDNKPRWRWRHPVTFHRGFPAQVDAPLADVFVNGQPTEWALAVVREWPVTSLMLTDRVSNEDRGQGELDGSQSFDWLDEASFRNIGNYYESGSTLPSELFAEVKKLEVACRSNNVAQFPTPTAATLALATACGTLLRRWAGVG